MSLGIALGGGGAKGFAHIGILDAFSEAGVQFDVVTGTSIGSIVGAAYASGRLPELKKRSLELKLTDLPKLLSPTLSHSGLFSGKNTMEFLAEIISAETFEELPKKFGAVGTNLLTGEIEEFTTGSIRDGLRASIAIPGLFEPHLADERVMVDGGVLEPVPVELAKKLGATKIVAVDLFSNTEKPEAAEDEEDNEETSNWSLQSWSLSAVNYLKSSPLTKNWLNSDTPNMIDILHRSLSLTQKRISALRMLEHKPDFLIEPAVSGVQVMDFHKGERAVELGRVAAEGVVSEFGFK